MAPYKVNGQPRVPRKGGRRPKEEDQEQYLSPEDAMKVQRRRSRNREAAARCRFRRVQQIETLTAKVEQLQIIQKNLQAIVKQLSSEKKELEWHLNLHESTCKLQTGRFKTHNNGSTNGNIRHTIAGNSNVITTTAFDQYEISDQPQHHAFSMPLPPFQHQQRPDSLNFYGMDDQETGLTPNNEYNFIEPLNVHTGLTPTGMNGLSQVFTPNNDQTDFPHDPNHILTSMGSATEF